jgi:predicted nucleotidyltransferase
VSAQFENLLPTLVGAGVEFVLVGGVAGIVHGSARATYDVDVVYSRADENIERLASALASHKPYLRDTPPGLPFTWNPKTIRSGLNFTLTTELGDIDLFGELVGGDTYRDLLPHSFEVEAFGVRFKCVDLPTLIRIKEAAGRAKDREALAELRVLLEESQRSG